MADDEYEGRPSKRVTLRTREGARWIAHLDRTTYQHLYGESDQVVDLKRRTQVPGKSVSKTEYRAEGGRLWPTRHESYQVPSGGKKQPLTETTFVEYVPYTPTADELDMEKQFGVKPIPHEPRPGSAQPKASLTASRSRNWMYPAAPACWPPRRGWSWPSGAGGRPPGRESGPLSRPRPGIPHGSPPAGRADRATALARQRWYSGSAARSSCMIARKQLVAYTVPM